MKRCGVAALVALVSLLLLATSAVQAHTRSVSYSSWDIDEAGARVRVRIPLLELSRLAMDPALDVGSGGRAARYLAERLRLQRGEALCSVPEPPVSRKAPEGWAHFDWRVECAASGPATLTTAVLLEVAPSHMHFARVVAADGSGLERLLTEAEPRWALGSSAEAEAKPSGAQGTSLAGYVLLGVEHILTGWDHMAFVVALLLLASTLGELAGLVTSFTIAHSVTLALATLGLVHPEGAAVEALIGFSIALVAAENTWILAGRGRGIPLASVGGLLLLALVSLWGVGRVSTATLLGLALFSFCHFGLLARTDRPARLRAAVAFAFGLVHGFGFAGVLAEMQLPTHRLAPALFGFNVGVELGQLALVALTWPLFRLLASRAAASHRLLAEAASAAICGLGLYWFLLRALG